MKTSTTVAQLLQAKGSDVFWVAPYTSAYGALELLAARNVGALLVFETEKLIGMFSERDYARKVILQGRSARDTLVREIMTQIVASVSPEDTIDKCMALMTDKRVRHLPVMEGDKVVGLVSIGDVVKAIIAEEQSVIGQLENYIKGAPSVKV